MSNVLNQQQIDLKQQLQELVRVGVGGKFKDTSDYTAFKNMNKNTEIYADKAEIDLIDKRMKISMIDQKDKVKISGEY